MYCMLPSWTPSIAGTTNYFSQSRHSHTFLHMLPFLTYAFLRDAAQAKTWTAFGHSQNFHDNTTQSTSHLHIYKFATYALLDLHRAIQSQNSLAYLANENYLSQPPSFHMILKTEQLITFFGISWFCSRKFGQLMTSPLSLASSLLWLKLTIKIKLYALFTSLRRSFVSEFSSSCILLVQRTRFSTLWSVG